VSAAPPAMEQIPHMKRAAIVTGLAGALVLSQAGVATALAGKSTVVQVTVARTANCPRSSVRWGRCDDFSLRVNSPMAAEALFTAIRRLAESDAMATLRYRRQHHGSLPTAYCPADVTRLVLRLTFRTRTAVAARVLLRPNGPGVCTIGQLVAPGARALSFTAFGITTALNGYLEMLSRDLGMTPTQLCPRSSSARTNVCGFR
jgi:uncharacterized low-complexity protein